MVSSYAPLKKRLDGLNQASNSGLGQLAGFLRLAGVILVLVLSPTQRYDPGIYDVWLYFRNLAQTLCLDELLKA